MAFGFAKMEMGLGLLGCAMGFGGLQRRGFGGEQRWFCDGKGMSFSMVLRWRWGVSKREWGFRWVVYDMGWGLHNKLGNRVHEGNLGKKKGV
ncbi:unnamed protein product [Prunus armeniaca]